MSTGPRAADAPAHPAGAVTSLEDPPQVIPAQGRFLDRRDAGRRLAVLLERFRDEDPVVVGMPRGGLPVAAEVARALNAPLDVAVVRKIGAPQNPEFALGALAEGGVQVMSRSTFRALGLSESDVRALLVRGERELAAANPATCAGSERRCRWRGARSSSSTTASPRATLRTRRSNRCAAAARPGWCSLFRSQRRPRRRRCVASPTRSSAWRCPRTCGGWGTGTRTSAPRTTPR